MNSSVRSTSVLRQSASLVGSDDDSSAFLRRCVSRCWRAATRAPGRAHHLLQGRPGLGLGGALGRGEEGGQLAVRPPWPPGPRTGGVPSTSLVWPSNCGSASRTVTTAVIPSSTSSLTTSSPALSRRVALQRGAERLGQRALEAGHVGAALGGGDDVHVRARRGVVAGPPADGDVDVEVTLDVGRGHVAGVVEHRHGLGEPVLSLQPDHLGDRLVGRQELAELRDPALVQEPLDGRLGTAGVRRRCSARPGTRKLVCRARLCRSSRRQLRVLQEDLPVGPVADPGAGRPLAGSGRPCAVRRPG